jgi:hypothetical protein
VTKRFALLVAARTELADRLSVVIERQRERDLPRNRVAGAIQDEGSALPLLERLDETAEGSD